MTTKRMRVSGGLALATAFSIGALAPPAVAGDLPPAEAVLATYAEAIGGETLAGVENMTAEMTFSMPMQGVYATAEELWARPDRFHFRIDLAAMGVTDFEAGVVDGVAWQSHPMSGTRELAGSERMQSLRRAARNPFAEWQKYFETAETTAEEVLDAQACYKVVFTPAEGSPLSAYFDKETGLLLREEQEGPTGSSIVTTWSDYEETQGIRSARTVKTEGPESYTLEITSVAYDVEDLPEDAFELPASLRTEATE